MDQLIKEQRDVYNTTTEAINKNFGEHAQQATVTPNKKGGTTVVPEKTKPTAPSTTGGPSTGKQEGHTVGSTIVQGGQHFKVTKVDANGKVLAAEPIKTK